MERVSANYLSILTGTDRKTIQKRCEELETQPGPNNSKLYNSEQALKAIYLGGGSYQSAAMEKARLDHYRANVEQMREGKMRGDLVPFGDVVRAVSGMIAECRAKLLAAPSRVAQSLPVEPEVRRQVQDQIQTEIFAALNELSENRLQGAPGMDQDLESPAEDDGKRVGGGGKVSQPGGKRRARKVAKQ